MEEKKIDFPPGKTSSLEDPEVFIKMLKFVLFTKFRCEKPCLAQECNCTPFPSPDKKWVIWKKYDYDNADHLYDSSSSESFFYLFALIDSKLIFVGSFYYESTSGWGAETEKGSYFEWKNEPNSAIIVFKNKAYDEMDVNSLELEKIKEILKKSFGDKTVNVIPNELNIKFDDSLYEEMMAYQIKKELEKAESDRKWKERREKEEIDKKKQEENSKKEEKRQKNFVLQNKLKANKTTLRKKN